MILFSCKIIHSYKTKSNSMSLFKLKSLATKVFPGQQFDERHMAVDLIDKRPAIALANFQGILRMFLIIKSKEVNLQAIYENRFETGIIAVEFVSHPDDSIRHSTLGVLFFRKFAFISLEAMNGHYQAKIMNVGVEPSFGICMSPLSVMTLNSSIQSINPPQIHKIKVADPIYPFASQLSRMYFMDGEELVEIDGATEQWRIILGRVRQLFVMGETVIAVGERALWQVNHAKIIKTKIMEEDISCGAIAFRSTGYNIMIANFSAQLLVYSSNYELLWALKLEYIPIKLLICQHSEIKGMLVLLSDQGSLELGYSGVQIPESIVEPISETIDYAVVESETSELLNRMNSKDNANQVKKEQILNVKQGYKIYFSQAQNTYQTHEDKQKLFQIDAGIVKCQLICQITSVENLRNFRVQVNLPYNLYCKDQIKDLRVAKNKDKIIFNIFASNQRFPYEKEFTAMVRYENNQQSNIQIIPEGAPFIKSETLQIPMGLQCIVSGFDSKDSFENKIIIKSSLQLPSFNNIFPELFTKGSQQQRKSIKFTLANGVQCAIVYNKSFNKAKIQSEYYSGLCYIITQFSSRVRQYSQRTSSKIELSVQIPLEEFFGIMKQHYEHRQVWKKAFDDVEVKSAEFRNTQKKLLIKMKEKMSNLGSVDKLLEFVFQRLMDSASRYEEVTQKMDIINHNLCVAIKLIIELLFIRVNPSQKARNMALGILGYEKESMQRGWQDKVYANSAHFLNRKYNKGDHISFQQLQKIPLYVISKVNNGDWN